MKSLPEILSDNEDAAMSFVDDESKPLLERIAVWLESPDRDFTRALDLLIECTGKLTECVGKESTPTLATLAACAAGEWRYDVENAPEKETVLGGFYDHNDHFFFCPVSRVGATWVPGKPITFATINPPEINP